MAGGVTLNVRQIGSYPAAGAAGPGDQLLMQPGGLGNPYATIDAARLVASALNIGGGPIGVGVTPPTGANEASVWTGQVVLPVTGPISWGGTVNTEEAFFAYYAGGFNWGIGPSVPMVLSNAGALQLLHGTLTVARDPGSAMEVATAGWVGANTVGSFNGRKGAVTLNGCDIYSALCLTGTIATEPWVMAAIKASTEMLLANHPFVFGWNGRTGAVWLTLADISCVFFQPGQKPITQTPPVGSNDYSIANTAWVVNFINNELEGAGGIIATQQWVLANTVNSFNGRMGPVTLTGADVFDVGAAPLNSPNFSGIPTAPTANIAQATGQIATTAFVHQVVSANTAGVATWNTRTGDVVMTAADIIAANGLTNPSAALTGNPTAPTQPPGTNLPVIATCEFVQTALNSSVQSFNTRTGAVVLTLADVTGVGGAPLVSPAFSSVPTAPTAAPGTNTVQLATTAFVTAALAVAGGVSSFNGRTGVVDLIPNDISAAGGLVNPSVNLTGSPTATTATAGDNSQRIATTSFVATALSSGAVLSFNTRTGAVTLVAADITAAGGALLAGPAFTGSPTAPTATAGTNNTQLATTQFVNAAIAANTATVTSFNTRTGAVVLTMADITAAGGAPLASPSFTGTPLGPTAAPGTSTTQLATTAFVAAAIASSGVTSFNSRTGAVTLIANDVSAAGGALLASPIFTGNPTAPTPVTADNTTSLATTAFVKAQGYVTSSGVTSITAGPGLTGGTITGTGTVALATPVSVANGGSGASTIAGAPWLPLSGGTLTGTLNGATGSFSGNLSTSGAFGCNGVLTVNGPSIANLNGGTSIQPPCTVFGNGIGYSSLGTHVHGWSWNGSAIVAWVDGGNQGTVNLTPCDERLKKNLAAPTVDALAAINAIALKQFDWIATDLVPEHHEAIGFTAQQLYEAVPNAVSFPDDPGAMLGVQLTPIVAHLIGAVQQISHELLGMQARLAALEEKAPVS